MKEKHWDYINEMNEKLQELEQVLSRIQSKVEEEETDPTNHGQYWRLLWFRSFCTSLRKECVDRRGEILHACLIEKEWFDEDGNYICNGTKDAIK